MKSRKLSSGEREGSSEEASSFRLKDHTFMCDGAKLSTNRLAMLYDD